MKNIFQLRAAFQKMDFPNCAGDIDVTHGLVICPWEGASEYTNCGGHRSPGAAGHREGSRAPAWGALPGPGCRGAGEVGCNVLAQAGTLFSPSGIIHSSAWVPAVTLGDPAEPPALAGDTLSRPQEKWKFSCREVVELKVG